MEGKYEAEIGKLQEVVDDSGGIYHIDGMIFPMQVLAR